MAIFYYWIHEHHRPPPPLPIPPPPVEQPCYISGKTSLRSDKTCVRTRTVTDDVSPDFHD